MLKIPTKIRYSLRILVKLSEHEHDKDGYISVQALAEEQELSAKYIEQLMSKLKKSRLVASREGSGGGYRLAVPSSEIDVGRIFAVFEPGFGLIECLGKQKKCRRANDCRARQYWHKLDSAFKKLLSETTVADLLRDRF